jgi:ferredoxin-fold anticodon binding domain-containing protein
MQKPNVVYKLENITQVMEDELKQLVDKNLEGKMESSLKKVYAKSDDVEVIIRVNVTKITE